MRIGFVSNDWSGLLDPDGHPTPGGAGWYRCALPSRTLSAFGIFSVHGFNLGTTPNGDFAVQTHDGQWHADLDVVVFQRLMHSSLPDMCRRARSTGQTVLNDCDDWYDGLDTSNVAFHSSHPRRDPNWNRDHYRKVLAASTGLTVSTPYLAQRLENVNSNIVVVENAIDLARWEFRDVGDEPPIIGWVGATGFRSHDLETLVGVLDRVCREHDVPFHHAGHIVGPGSAADAMKLSEEVRTSVWSLVSILDYPKVFDDFNIGIVPLRDTPFNLAKSDIKGLEYGAAGIPFVAAATPAYCALEESGGGFTARRPKDWLRYLTLLLDPDERRKAGHAAHMASQGRDIQLRWTAWLDAYTQLAQ